MWKKLGISLLFRQALGHTVQSSQVIINNTLQRGILNVLQQDRNTLVEGDFESEGWSGMQLSFVWKVQKGCPPCTYLIGLSMAGWGFCATRCCLSCIGRWSGAGDGPEGKLFIIPQTPLTDLYIRTVLLSFFFFSCSPSLFQLGCGLSPKDSGACSRLYLSSFSSDLWKK